MSDPLQASQPIGVRFSGVSKAFPDGACAMDDVSFSVAPGAFSVLVGPSGCGKTTALRMMSLDVPSQGEVVLQERLRAQRRTRRPPDGLITVQRTPGMVGYCFQEPRLLPWRTVLENVCLPFELDDTLDTSARDRARATLADVGLDDALHKDHMNSQAACRCAWRSPVPW